MGVNHQAIIMIRETAPVMDDIMLWLDGADASTFSLTGALVDQWDDKSGNNNHGTPSGTGVNDHRPTKSGNGVVFAADGLALNDVKGLSFGAGVASGAGLALSYYLVWKRVMQRDDVVLHGGGANYAYLQYTGDRWWFSDSFQEIALANNVTALKSARGNLASGVTRATNGVEHANQAFINDPVMQSLGAGNTYAGGFDGTVYELLAYNVLLTNARHLKNINYLKAKWSIT